MSKTFVFRLLTVSLLLAYGPRPAAAAMIGIPITIIGLSPQLSVTVIIDGESKGTIPGGSSETFSVDSSRQHTFEVDAEIKGDCASYAGTDVCTKYSNANNAWTLKTISTQNCQQVPVCYNTYYYCTMNYCYYVPYCEYEQQCWSTTELAEKGHTFAYAVEQEVVVKDLHGQNTDTWQTVGSNVNLSANEFVVTVDDPNTRRRDIFVQWVVNGAPMQGRTLALKVDKPLYIEAQYQTETKYKISWSSDFGNPSLDSPDGWYLKGQQATISVQKEVPAEGLMGALGGKKVLVAWHSPQGVESKDPTYRFAVQDAKLLNAEWNEDDSQPMAILAGVAIAIIVLIAVLVLYRTGRLSRPKVKEEPTELDKTKAEVESLK